MLEHRHWQIQQCTLQSSVLAHDWVITHTLQKSALSRHNLDPAGPLADAEAHKNSYARVVCEAVGVDFMPLAADTFGEFGVLAEEAMCKAAREAQLLRGGNALSCT